jgi:integrase/recombinase XerD
MTKLKAENERIKRDYLRYLHDACGKNEKTVEATLAAINRFESFTGHRAFKGFRREHATAFKTALSETTAAQSGKPLSAATQVRTLSSLKAFFAWLAWQPGFKSKLDASDADYFTPSKKDRAKARSGNFRDFPSLEQIRAVIAAIPSSTVTERRDRAVIAFTILSGMRDSAIASLSLKHIDEKQSPVRVLQDPNSVKTKFSKAISTFLLPLGDDLIEIVLAWIDELKRTHLFGSGDPLFPSTAVTNDPDRGFHVDGISRDHWASASPIRKIFKAAFEAVDLPYYSPHTFRHTLTHLMETECRTPEEIRAFSQNLGHEHVATTLTNYGKLNERQQGEVIGRMALGADKPPQVDPNLAAAIAQAMQHYEQSKTAGCGQALR